MAFSRKRDDEGMMAVTSMADLAHICVPCITIVMQKSL